MRRVIGALLLLLGMLWTLGGVGAVVAGKFQFGLMLIVGFIAAERGWRMLTRDEG